MIFIAGQIFASSARAKASWTSSGRHGLTDNLTRAGINFKFGGGQ
jgi:hypothetical protein